MKRYFYITPEDYATAEKNGISKTTLDARVFSYGWDIDRAIKTPTDERKCFRKWWGLAEANGISKKLLRKRVNEYGWSPEKAATTPYIPKLNALRAAHTNRKKLFTDKEMRIAQSNGVSRQTAAKRIRNGWTREEALTIPPIRPHELGEFRKRREA